MNYEIIKLSFLTLLAGILCKLYDDMNDNNLFEKNDFFKKNKEYINEFLKSFHVFIFAFISAKSIYYPLFFMLFNLLNIIFDYESYIHPYEYTGIIILILFFLYYLFENYLSLYKTLQNILFNFQFIIINIIILLISIYLADVCFFKNIEFGNKKLFVRFLGFISLLLFIIFNNYFHFFDDELILFSWYLVGYCFVSCIFQIILIKEDEKNKQKNVIIEDGKKEAKLISEEENKEESVIIEEENKEAKLISEEENVIFEEETKKESVIIEEENKQDSKIIEEENK